jgi:NNP family nitrate/nitrite transporter-like MFS transporter
LRAGGYLGDLAYRRWGVPGKKYLMISLGITQGLLSLGLGMYIDNHEHPSGKHIFRFVYYKILTWNIVATVIGMIVVVATASEAAAGVNFSLVPHCSPCECSLPCK